MLKTEHRPVPLPGRDPTGLPPADPARPGAAEGREGRWARRYFDEQGRERRTRDDVPVDEYGNLAKLPYRCPKDKADQWVSRPVAAKGQPICPVHQKRMRLVAVRGPALLPWAQMWTSQQQRLKAVWVGAGVGLLGEMANTSHMPAVVPIAAAIPATWAFRRKARARLVRRALADDPRAADPKLSITDLMAMLGTRERATVERRVRMVGNCVAGACTWTTLAASAGMDPHTLGGKLSLTLLAAAWLWPAATWWRYLRSQRRTPTGDGIKAPVGEPDVPVDPFELQVVSTWATRVGAGGGALPNTKLTKFSYVQGGWSAVAVSEPGTTSPDSWRTAVGRIAAAYRCGTQDVAVESDTADASQATVRVQRENPLCEVTPWPGPAETFNPGKGVSVVGRFGDLEDALYRWWNSGGPWHDLICGATGSGKSEFVNLLLLTGLNSRGLILDRVIDTQWGQSYGDLQDLVDWFAPDITEARLLLLDAVKEMRRRNRVLSKLRQKTWQATTDMPLIVITIDEAQDVLKDPICLALVEKLAAMARKCGIKLRIITQVPLVTQIGNSTPVKDALLGGNLVVFRTGSSVSTQVSIGPALPVDPHKLPAEWPKGSPAAGETTGGLGYMNGASRREVPWRSHYVGEDIATWLTNPTPGAPSPDMIEESGLLWGDRRARVKALFEGPADDTDILPDGLVDALLAAAAAKTPLAARRAVVPTVKPAEGSEDGSARVEVLRVVLRHSHDNRIEKSKIAEHARLRGEPMKARTLSDALAKLLADSVLLRVKNGVYEVTDKARSEASSAADAWVAEQLGPDPVTPADDTAEVAA